MGETDSGLLNLPPNSKQQWAALGVGGRGSVVVRVALLADSQSLRIASLPLTARPGGAAL